MKLKISQSAARDPAPALSRGIALIEWLSLEGQCSLERIAKRTGWPKSSTLRYLQALAAGVVRQDPTSYAWILRKNLQLLDSNTTSEIDHARQHLTHLVNEVGHCAELYQLSSDQLELIDRADPAEQENLLVAKIGYRRNLEELDATTLVRIAFGSTKYDYTNCWRWKNGKKQKVSKAIQSKELRKAKAQSYASDDEFNINGIRRFAIPLNSSGKLVGVLAIAQRQTPLAKEETDNISVKLLELLNKLNSIKWIYFT